MTASGTQDMIVGNGTGGDVWWYEQGGDPDTWTQHTVGTGFDEVEGTGVGDIDGDGNYEIGICDQKVGELHLAVPDSDDPTGSWSTVMLDDTAEYTQTVRFFDIDGDGDPELVYTVQGSPSSDTGNYGVRFQDFEGGDPLDAANWSQYEIAQLGGAFWLPYRMADMSGDGNATDLVVSCRAAHSHYEGGIHVLENPGDPTNTWTTRSYDTGTQHLICSFADFTGDGTTTDLVSHESPNSASGRVWISEYDGTDYTVSQFQGSSDAYNNAFAHNWSESAVSDLFLFNDTAGDQELWIHDGSDWVLEDSSSSAKAQDDVYAHDFNGDGTDDLATVGVNSGDVFWLEVNQS
ncbi:hypothetical protein [Halopiger xanaduensis]|uniref:FG-GAP repeat protein n=1 Tax=Halopiger xanaduensis (strain DSM 18323 / JCM 14033 / SH-6) TaxID=797210 RepID=F8DEU9_HALXS|nr:hypothetical protein [Halopiger xanaduensis]AEH39539.1 hypothetical protein Halxa_0300 [Halopiger xanaduensis SH-6]